MAVDKRADFIWPLEEAADPQNPVASSLLWYEEFVKAQRESRGWETTHVGTAPALIDGEQDHPGILRLTAAAGSFNNNSSTRQHNKGVRLSLFDFEMAWLVRASEGWTAAGAEIGSHSLGLTDTVGAGNPRILIWQSGGRSVPYTGWGLRLASTAGTDEIEFIVPSTGMGIPVTPGEWRWFKLNATADASVVEVRSATTWQGLTAPDALVMSEDFSANAAWPDGASDLFGANASCVREVINGTDDVFLDLDITYGIARNIGR